MVDIIHTDAGILGAEEATGSIDFWPNGGFAQPDCKHTDNTVEFMCDHARSWVYFAESVASLEPKFFAVKCASFEDFKNFNCSEDLKLNNMGIDARKKYTVYLEVYKAFTTYIFLKIFSSFGNYYLQTNSIPIFDRGILGARYSFDSMDRNNLELNKLN